MAQLRYCFTAVLAILSVKLVISDKWIEKRTAITNEEHIDEGNNKDILLNRI